MGTSVSLTPAASPPTQAAANLSSAAVWRERAARVHFDAEALAQLPEVALSRRSLERRFLNEIRLPIDVALLQWKAEAARDYIIATGARTKDAAAKFGFCNSAHLAHAFKRFFQRPPQSFAPRKNTSTAR